MKYRFSLFTLLTLLFTTLAPTALATSGDGVISGATNDLDYIYSVYTENGNLYADNVKDEADANDNDEFKFFKQEDENDDQYLAFAMEAPFDKVYFDIASGVDYNETNLDDLRWEYLTEDGWEPLDITQDSLDYGTSAGIKYVMWRVPSDWEEELYISRNAFWVRVGTDMEVDDAGEVDQVSVRVYNLSVTITDEDAHKISDLDLNDFDLSSGSNNTIYSMRNLGNGVYEFALQAESSDTTYVLEIDADGYDHKNINVGPITNEQKRYSIQLNDTSSNNNNNNDDDHIFIASVDCEMPFVDVNNHWAQVEIHDAYCRDVVDGKSYYYFDPNTRITRAEFVKIALLNAEVDVDYYADRSDEDFRDVRTSDWYYEYAAASYELGITTSKYYFRPNDYINRAEAITILARLANQYTYLRVTPFPDVDPMAWYAPYVRAAYDEGVVEGYNDNTFRPENHLTRAEAAVMASNAFEAWHLEP